MVAGRQCLAAVLRCVDDMSLVQSYRGLFVRSLLLNKGVRAWMGCHESAQGHDLVQGKGHACVCAHRSQQ